MEVITFIPCPTCGHHKEERMIYTQEELAQVLNEFAQFMDLDISSVQLKFYAEGFVKKLLEKENAKD